MIEKKCGLDIIKESCLNWSLKTQDKHCKVWISQESLIDFLDNLINQINTYLLNLEDEEESSNNN